MIPASRTLEYRNDRLCFTLILPVCLFTWHPQRFRSNQRCGRSRLALADLSFPERQEDYWGNDEDVDQRANHSSENRCREWLDHFGAHILAPHDRKEPGDDRRDRHHLWP